MKYKNLQILKENGINVPDFAVLNFESLVQGKNELRREIERHKAEDINDIIENSRRLKETVRRAYIRGASLDATLSLGFDKYAVRSSCNAEDGRNNSFAGQFKTYLNVERDDIEDKILLCLESLYEPNVLEYAYHNGIDVNQLKMNVILQKMIHGDCSGVLFTSNPQGILNESVIVVGKGLGEGIVSDRVDTTAYYYNTTDHIYYYDGKEDFLSRASVLKLVEMGNKIKQILGNDYLDIEFTIKDNTIHILQARPITTIDDSQLVILDNSNIVESYPGISLPLTDSFVNIVYSGVFKGVSARVLKNKKIVEQCEDIFNNMVGSSNGRMYYKISNWYTIIKFLPFNRKIIPVWQDMLGVKNKNYDKERVSLSGSARVRTYFNSVYEILMVPSNMKKLNKRFIEINDCFYSRYHKDLTNEELVQLYDEIKDKLLSMWDVTLLNDLYTFIFTGLLKSRLRKRDPEHYEERTIDLISGISNIESMKPVRELIELSALSLTGRETKEYEKRYTDYIQIYGDRAMEELKLEAETFRTNPSLLEDRIREYTMDIDKLKQMQEAVSPAKEKALKGTDMLFDFYVSRAMTGIKNRELSRLNRSRIFGMVRAIFLSFAENFTKQKLIRDEKDIFYLKAEEIFDLVMKPRDVTQLIERRKAEYKKYSLLPAYSRLVFAGQEFNKNNKSINSNEHIMVSHSLQGIPCSRGKVTGEVLIINNAMEAKNVKDKILVTKMTDPGWVFLLASARGIITEKGSLLSHTAIISRELKIPAIVGVDHALDILKNNMIVSMDGNTGMIEILEG